MTAAIVAIVLAVLASGGVVYASDAAGPGDALYGIDQAVEQARLGVTANPERAVQLQLGFADERLEEAAELLDEEDLALLQEALGNYGSTISSVVDTIETSEGIDEDELTEHLELSLSGHAAQLGQTFRHMEHVEAGGEPGSDFCVGAGTHPAAQMLATLYEGVVSYDDIMGWFCEGDYGLGEIMLALQTSEEAGIPVGDLLGMRSEIGGWGQVWRELDLTRGNRPDHAGRPEEPGQQGNQGQGQGNEGNQGQGQGQGSEGNQGQGQGSQGNEGNQGQGQGQGNEGNQGQGQGQSNEGNQGNQGQGNQGNQGQGQGQGDGDDNQDQGNAGQNLGDISEECLANIPDEDVVALTALSEEYDIEYEDVLELYCEGLTLEEIEARLMDGSPGQGQGQGQGQGNQGGGQGNQP